MEFWSFGVYKSELAENSITHRIPFAIILFFFYLFCVYYPLDFFYFVVKIGPTGEMISLFLYSLESKYAVARFQYKIPNIIVFDVLKDLSST